MSTPQQPRLSDLPVVPNPHTERDPLVVRDHPYVENPVGVAFAALAILGPLVAVAVRTFRSLDPVLDGPTLTALWIGIPLGLLTLWFVGWLSTGTVVSVDDSTLRRRRRRPVADERVVPIADIRGGLLASAVRYSRGRTGSELILFLTDGTALGLAGGISDGDMRRVADALSSRGIKEYQDPTTTTALLSLVKALQRAEATAASGEDASDDESGGLL